MPTRFFLLGFTSLVSMLAVGASTAKTCSSANRTITLNADDNKFGYSHDGQAIPDGYRGLGWSGFFDAPNGPMPPSGQYSIGTINAPFAYFYVNTTEHPNIQSLTIHSFALGCQHLEQTGPSQTGFVVDSCGVTVSAVNNADDYSDAVSNMYKTEHFQSSAEGFSTVVPKKGFTGTHFYFFLTSGFPSSVFYLDNIVVQNECST